MAEESSAPGRPTPLLRRSSALPLRPSGSTQWASRGNSTPADSIENLYVHSSVRIVAFESSSGSYNRTSPNDRNSAEADEAGTLPWISSFERTIAVGPLRIYRAPGSVAFINCGRVIQPILPKSRCWCVDDDSSKFILQMRRPLFWRIEVPIDDPNHRMKSQELKDVFSQILLFEKTPCPFRRSFHIEIPEAPKTPVKKKPWKPVEQPSSERHDSICGTAEAKTAESSPTTKTRKDYDTTSSSDDNIGVPEMDTDNSDATDDTNITPRNYFPRSQIPHSVGKDILSRPEVLDAGHAGTAPPQLTLLASPPSKNTNGLSLGTPLRSESRKSSLSDFSSSQGSFHSVQSWHGPVDPMPPSPPESLPVTPTMCSYPQDSIKLPKRRNHIESIPETAVSSTSEIPETPETPLIWRTLSTPISQSTARSEETCPSSPPPPTTPTPTHTSKSKEDPDDEHLEIVPSLLEVMDRAPRRRTSASERSSRRRALSPLPPAANLFSPSRPRSSHLQTARHLPTAIIQKTWEILMSPPSHLMQLMLEIAAKISAGEWRGVVFGFGEGGEKVVGQWDYDDCDFAGDGWGEADEDDYGMTRAVSGHELMKKRTANKGPPGGFDESWEID